MLDASREKNEREIQIPHSERTNVEMLINEKIQYIAQNASVKDVKKNVKNQIVELVKLVSENGLEVAQLAAVLNILFVGKLECVDIKRLVKILLPRANVPNFLIIKVLSNLGNKGLNYNVQALLLRWIIIVYNVIEDHSQLIKFYGVIFHYMEYDTLRPFLCHILYLMTRREHVKPYRIRKLIDLRTRFGPEPHLLGLLTLYKDFFPNLVTIRIPPIKNATFKCPDVEWFQLFNQIQRKWNYNIMNNPITRSSSFKPTAKRRKLDHVEIPKACTFNATRNSITLEEIMNIESLASSIDKIDLPSQLASVLENRMLQHIVVCNPEKVTIARISYWLEQCLMELVYWNDNTAETKARLNSLLMKLVALTEFMKELLPVIQEFLVKYIQTWDGIEHQEAIFKLLSFLRPEPFEQLSEKFFTPLQNLHEKLSSSWKARLIRCYTDLFTHWILFQENNFGENNNEIEKSENSFLNLSIKGDYSRTIQGFIHHVNQVSIISLESTNDDLEVQHAIFSAFEAIANLQMNYNWNRVVIPSSSIVYRAFFSSSGMSLSRICGIILQYKEAFDKNPQQNVSLHCRSYINYFNSFVMDICNCLWRNRPFNKTDKNSKGFQLDDDIIRKLQETCNEDWTSCYSLTHLPSFAALSKSCIQDLEESTPNIKRRLTLPATQFSLKDISTAGGLQISFNDYRVHFLNVLYKLGFVGIHDFLYQSLTSLSKLKNKP
ncbi:Mis6-domain-containing protein [Rhizophagus irregularis]|uniref:Mis6-domain-containing protein n=1 Tax=Rhizophagus irregularis TaxID=588596 RepID=A0A2I1EKM0_9GLOM|nr:Mis6-domain-containing protein [Rhizophagus irregularis]PKY22662.1 Mis6-domain-containing protein [Rhizophagus irregularis]